MKLKKTLVNVFSDISILTGIGPKKQEAFNKLGIFNIYDLIYTYPRAYENRGIIKKISEVKDGEICSLIMTVSSRPSNARINGGMIITKFNAFDDTGKCSITFFNNPYIKDKFNIGDVFRFYGRVKRGNSVVFMSSPIMEHYFPNLELRNLYPVYRLSTGLNQKGYISFLNAALYFAKKSNYSDQIINEYLPENVLKNNALCGIDFALQNIHFPNNFDDYETAKRRLAFEEIYLFALSLKMNSKSERIKTDKLALNVNKETFFNQFPYAPTSAQKRSFDEIEKDLKSGYKMHRLLTGDVGSGKTMVAMFSAFVMISSGYQVSIMAPTEILAMQHYETINPILSAMGYKVELLVGSLSKKKKLAVTEKIKNGECNLVIGTHALIEDTIEFFNLGLAIIDEQHRFGAIQREKLVNKGKNVHSLAMSATPIPRSLALVLYGDYDLSTLDELPPGRQKVNTFVIDESYRGRLNEFLRKSINEGGQVYIVCPSIEEQEKIESEGGEEVSLDELYVSSNIHKSRNLKAAIPFKEELDNIFSEFKVGMIHGKMKQEEKDRVMKQFANNEINILVSTTVIEVGVNVPNASVMIVENAENFGLSQLHQLRGRVGRGTRKSYCFLMSDTKGEDARKRLETIRNNIDGYKIAEIDLEMRGPGDFLKLRNERIRQSGEFMPSNSFEIDTNIMYDAFKEADRTLLKDHKLEGSDKINLKEKLAYINNGGISE